MVVQTLKSTIFEEINGITNEETLSFLQDIILNITSAEVYTIPEHVKDGIEKGLEDVKSGRVLTEQQVDDAVDKWFKS